MNARSHILRVVVLFVFTFVLARPALSKEDGISADRRPNVLVILADDMGWGDLSATGNRNLQTPRIDSLARDGLTMDRFFVCPVCSPTRAEFLTGRYHPRGGVRNVSTGGERLDLDEHTIAEAFAAAGYSTAAFGKWHNGTQFPYHPNARGFGEYYGFTSGHWGDYFDPVLEHNNELTRGTGFIIDDLTNHAIAFIEQHRDAPFFCYVPFNTPHSPFQVPDRFYRQFEDSEIKQRNRDPQKEKLEVTRAVLAMNANIDWNVGRLLDKLDELELRDNTIVVFFSDNGPNSWRYNGGMKGRKGAVDEGGVRVPCFIRYPGVIPAGFKTEQIAGAIDLLPTLMALTGTKWEPPKPLDGMDLSTLMKGGDPPAAVENRQIFSHWRGRVSVRTNRYRLGPQGELFDMKVDPGQTTDISGQQPAIAKALRQSADHWRRTVLAEMEGPDLRPFPIGAGHELTWLPARDGRPHGSVQRSARAPNCSFFTNWKKTTDRITWDVEVAAPGDYVPVVYYTCRESDVGCRIELAVGDAKQVFQVDEAHDPPLYGDNHDRASRGSESLVKDFRPLKLKPMKLAPGRATLSLRALEIPGEQVIDVRWVLFRKLTR